MNAAPRQILRSPAHRLLSSRYLLLAFTGRRTGRRYSTPVAYCQHHNRILISTDSPWWRNVAAGEPVAVRLRGKDYVATSSRVTGAAAVDAMRKLVAIPGYPRAAGIPRVRGVIAEAEIERAAQRRVVLAIDLAEPL